MNPLKKVFGAATASCNFKIPFYDQTIQITKCCYAIALFINPSSQATSSISNGPNGEYKIYVMGNLESWT
jgi:hypothetical protein